MGQNKIKKHFFTLFEKIFLKKFVGTKKNVYLRTRK